MAIRLNKYIADAGVTSRRGADSLIEAGRVKVNGKRITELGFKGNQSDYYDPRNSYLNEVMERKLGIPITLSVIHIEVGKRLGLPVQGVSFPGHFLVKCALRDGTAVIDPFAGGASLGIKDLQARLRSLSGSAAVPPEAVMRMLGSAPPSEIIARMLRNLKAIHVERGEKTRALTANSADDR